MTAVTAVSAVTAEASLAWLLCPLRPEEFLGRIWAVRHHLVPRHDPRYFAGLFGLSELENVLGYSRPGPTELRLVRDHEDSAPASYRLPDGTVDLVQVRKQLADGFSVVLNGVEHRVPAVGRLAHALELELDFEVQVNAYVTPPGSRGFLPHYDDHDVLVLQVQGSKTWHVYGADDDVPPHEMPQRDAFVGDRLGPPSDLCLEAGDVLYVPRGRVHAAEANAEPSIHLTLGIHAPTVHTLLTKVLDALRLRDDRLLERLPPRYLSDPRVRAGLSELALGSVGAAREPGAVQDGLALLEDALVRRGRCRPAGQLLSGAGAAEPVGRETRVEKLRPLYSRVVALEGGVALQFAQSVVRAGPDHRAALLFLSRSTEPFQVGELPGLSDDQQVELARELLVDGFLIRAPAP